MEKTMKMSDLKAGDFVVLDNGFTCRGPGEAEIKADSHGLYFDCCAADEEAHEQGTDAQVDPARMTDRHYLDGQEDDGGELVGMVKK